MTTYLPVKITQAIELPELTERLTLYPIFENWDGVVRAENKISFLDENNNPISQSGAGTHVLHIVNATCTEPYFVEVKNADEIGDGSDIKFENTTAPVPSIIYWGDTKGIRFDEPQSGTIYYIEEGKGIVPADYNNNNDDTHRNNGAGNQEVSGTYHLSFTSFYPATVNLPKQAEMTSFLELTCINNADSPHIQKSEFSRIFVYDVWFRIE